MLNPYQKELLLQESKKADELKVLSKKVRVETMKTFTLTYDRHEGRYGFKNSNFPESYPYGTSIMEYNRDPDWTVKLKPQRLPL